MQRYLLPLMLTLLAGAAVAQDVRSEIAAQLREQGYSSVEVSKTWLGRLRFEAVNGAKRREIIVNPRTGEILRDFLSVPEDQNEHGVQILDRSTQRRDDEREGRPEQGSRPSPQNGGGSGANGPEGPPQ